MEFEYDARKSAANRTKHGVSLEEAQALWSVPSVALKARIVGEDRWMIIGPLKGQCYSCVFTMRQETIRLISARRSHPNEEQLYHAKIQTPSEREAV